MPNIRLWVSLNDYCWRRGNKSRNNNKDGSEPSSGADETQVGGATPNVWNVVQKYQKNIKAIKRGSTRFYYRW